MQLDPDDAQEEPNKNINFDAEMVTQIGSYWGRITFNSERGIIFDRQKRDKP